MSLVCPKCGAYAVTNLHHSHNSVRCGACKEIFRANIYPLFVVTGASGTGKTSILPYLRSKLREIVVFDKDLLWNRCGDQFYNNWLRTAYSIAQGGRFTLISGIIMPSDFDTCEDRNLVGAIYYINLFCSDEILEKRLNARPAWRQCSNEWFINEHKLVEQRLLDLSSTHHPPIPSIDTSNTTPNQVAEIIIDWVLCILNQYPLRKASLQAPTD
jgi:hypothetical protein